MAVVKPIGQWIVEYVEYLMEKTELFHEVVFLYEFI